MCRTTNDRGERGDSRAYLIKDGAFSQISRDHSWVSEQVEAGLLSRADAQVHIYRNIITRSLGSRPDVDVDTFSVPLQVDDAVLLCSDGLSNEVGPTIFPNRRRDRNSESGCAARRPGEHARRRRQRDGAADPRFGSRRENRPCRGAWCVAHRARAGHLACACQRPLARLPGAAVLPRNAERRSPVTTAWPCSRCFGIPPVQRGTVIDRPTRQSRSHIERATVLRRTGAIAPSTTLLRQEFRCEPGATAVLRVSAASSFPPCEIAPSKNWLTVCY